MGTESPAADRSPSASVATFLRSPERAETTQVTGSGLATQSVMSFPPMDTVINRTWPRWARRNASAAAAWLWVRYDTAPETAVGPYGAAHPAVVRIDDDVAPPHPKLARVEWVVAATRAVYPAVGPGVGEGW